MYVAKSLGKNRYQFYSEDINSRVQSQLEIEVALRDAADSGIGVRAVRFTVRDSGRGIAPELQERLFEPFFTTRAEGTGLGLALARGVARAHGGDITLRSTPGQGATFTLSLPLALDDAQAGPPDATDSTPLPP